MSAKIWPIILSGGVGARLWPLSRADSPKQLLPLAGERTLIQETALRVGDAARFERPLVVAGKAHADAIERQLAATDADAAAIIVEPAGRNTAPAIALAAHWLAARQPGALMLVMPSDHVIADVPAFLQAVALAEGAARDGWLVTFGIRAVTPETGYGYIRLGEAIGGGVLRVDRFIEKPARNVAEDYVRDGGYAWNGGIFLMRADRYLTELALHAPAISAATGEAAERAREADSRVLPDAGAFLACPADSIDYAVMERAERVAVVPVEMGWSDIGSWDALHAIAKGDEQGNVSRGDVIAVDSRDCLLRSEGPLIAAVGLEGVTVVATGDAVLVAARGRAQDVKTVVDRLNTGGRRETTTPVKAAHGWGEERLLSEAGEVRVYEWTVRPGAEVGSDGSIHAVAIAGSALVEADGKDHPLSPGSGSLFAARWRLRSEDGATLIIVRYPDSGDPAGAGGTR